MYCAIETCVTMYLLHNGPISYKNKQAYKFVGVILMNSLSL